VPIARATLAEWAGRIGVACSPMPDLVVLAASPEAFMAMGGAIDYALRRWAALTRYLDDGAYPIDNNPLENAIRPIALGRKNWLFAGTEAAGRRAAAILSLIESAKLNGHDPFAYLKDVLTRLPTHPYRRLGELLPFNWAPAASYT
jgi:transposase